MSGHTQGPWEYLASDGEIVHQRNDSGAMSIAWSDADFKLMAAAPGLYAELELAADTFRDFANVLAVIGKDTLAAAALIAERSIRERLAALDEVPA